MNPDDHSEMVEIEEKIRVILRQYDPDMGVSVLQAILTKVFLHIGISYERSIEIHKKAWEHYEFYEKN